MLPALFHLIKKYSEWNCTHVKDEINIIRVRIDLQSFDCILKTRKCRRERSPSRIRGRGWT